MLIYAISVSCVIVILAIRSCSVQCLVEAKNDYKQKKREKTDSLWRTHVLIDVSDIRNEVKSVNNRTFQLSKAN